MNNNNKSCCKKSLFRRELWVVRMAFLFLTLGMWPANAAAAAPKATLLSINAKNKPVKEVFAEIEKKTEYIFFYSNDIVDVNRRVSVDVKNGTIETVLDQIFRSTDNSYEIKDRQIFIVKPEKNAAKKSESARQQPGTNRITGTVTDAKGNPLAGVNVIVKGTTIGVSSNIDGTYVIDVPLHASLVYSYIGYLNQEITPGAESICNIVLNEDNRVMEEVVVVGFGQQKKESVIGAIQSFKTSDMKMPAANLTNSFAGRIAGVISVQQSGEPGADGANFWIRGVSTFAEAAQNPLILIDGVECSSYDLNALAPEVIENFSILKDAAATAVYGVRGANGVVLVTTRGGIVGKPQINIKFEAGMVQPTKIPDMIDAVQFAEMYNAAAGYDFYSKKDIQMFRDGSDPDLHPNIDWVDRLYKDYSFNQRVNVNISGGGSTAKYYISGGFYNEDGLFKADNMKEYNTSVFYRRFNFRSNVEVQLHKYTKLNVNLATTFERKNEPGSSATGANGIWGYALKTAANAFPDVYSNGWPARRRDRARTPMRC